MRILNCHPMVKCINEPFNVHCHGEYLAQVKDNSLGTIFDQLWQSYNGVKHVADPGGWPFSQRDMNVDLLGSPGTCFILLIRRNQLRRVLSEELARQSRIWHFWMETDRDKLRRFEFKAIDVERVRSRLKEVTVFVDECRHRLQLSDARYFELAYESLFDGPTGNQQREVLDGLLDFLQLPRFTSDQEWHEISELLRPNRTGADSPSLYHRVENIQEIEQELGCDETGWLFN